MLAKTRAKAVHLVLNFVRGTIFNRTLAVCWPELKQVLGIIDVNTWKLQEHTQVIV